jgi:hypothetical protein
MIGERLDPLGRDKLIQPGCEIENQSGYKYDGKENRTFPARSRKKFFL